MTIIAVTGGERLWRKKGGGADAMLMTQFVVFCLCLLFILRFRGIGNGYSVIRTAASGRWLYSIGYSLVVDFYYVGKCLINPFFWAISIAWYRYGRKQAAGFFRGFPDLLTFRVSFVLIWAAILLVIPFVFIFITGDRPPLRICNLIVFFFPVWSCGPGGLAGSAGEGQEIYCRGCTGIGDDRLPVARQRVTGGEGPFFGGCCQIR
jgi:hypothetical protein